MKTSLLALIGLIGLSGAAVQAQFTPGNLVVSRVGNGTVAPPNTGAPISLLEYTSSGNLTATINIPETSLQWSGTATSEGALSLSQDGKFLTVAG